MPLASVSETVAEAVKTRLSGIVAGSVYNYTPDAVAIALRFAEEWLDASYSHLLFVIPQSERHYEDATGTAADGGVVRARMDVSVIVCRKFEPDTRNPLQATGVLEYETVMRSTADVIRRLALDPTLGGVARNVAVDGWEVDDGYFMSAAWACAEVRFTVEFDYLAGA